MMNHNPMRRDIWAPKNGSSREWKSPLVDVTFDRHRDVAMKGPNLTYLLPAFIHSGFRHDVW
jgi:hypothetical protein